MDPVEGQTRLEPSLPRVGPHAPRGETTWVTVRHLDLPRLASAWLIRRFIHPDAIIRFSSAGDANAQAGRGFAFSGAAYGGAAQEMEVARRSVRDLVEAFRLPPDPARDGTCAVLVDADWPNDVFGLRRLLETVRMREPNDDGFLQAASRFCDAYYEWAKAQQDDGPSSAV